MSRSYVVRVIEGPRPDGTLVARIESVESGTRGLLRSVEELVTFLARGDDETESEVDTVSASTGHPSRPVTGSPEADR